MTTQAETKTKAIAKELDYRVKDASVPKYNFNKVIAQQGAGSFTLSASATTEMMFDIPTKVFNFSRSLVNFTFSIAASGVGNYNWMYQAGNPWFVQVQVYTRSGTYLCDLNYCAKYMYLVSKKETKLENFLTNDTSTSTFTRSNCAKGTAFAAATPTQGDTRPDNTSSDVSYTEPRYMLVAAANTALTGMVQIRLGDIKNTILSFDKDLLFPEIITIRLVFAAGNQIAWYGTDAANPTTGAAALTSNITITNLCLQLCVDENPDVVNGLNAKLKEGSITMPVQFTQGYRTNCTGTSHNITQRFNRGNGAYLQKITAAPFNTTESANTAFDCANVNAAKISGGYYTSFDNERLQQQTITCDTATLLDWMIMKPLIRGGPLQSANVFQFNWFHCDDWTGASSPGEEKGISEDNLISGIPLADEHRWDLNATTAAGYNWYQYATFLRFLTISSKGVEMK